MADRQLSEAEKMEAFLTLVQSQDSGADVASSRRSVADRYGLSEQQVRLIEREGIEAGWPPLG